jgi:hypothetical protein
VEHTEVGQVAALAGALGAVLVLLPRGRMLPLAGFVFLGLATAALAWSLVGDDDAVRLLISPEGVALVGIGVAAAILGAVVLTRYPAIVPVVLLVAAPFRIPVELGGERAFLLLPLYLVLGAAALALAYRIVFENVRASLPLFLSLPIAALAGLTSVSFLWTWDERQGAITLAFFVFPFVAGLAVVARAPVASWLSRALLLALVGLGTVFAAIGIWQVHTRTLFFAPDLEVANAYTTYFRVTSLFKDPSIYGRYLVISIAALLVVVLVRRGRRLDWVAATAVIAFLFWGLLYSYSQSSFVALFVVTFAIAVVGVDRRTRTVLVACAAVALLTTAAVAGAAVGERSARDLTSGRSRLVSATLEVVKERPLAGVGVGGQPRASAELVGKGSPSRNASHTTPLTVLAELGVIGVALYVWLLVAVSWAIYLVTERDRTLGIGLGATMLALFIHSLFYAGFFEDPLTWGVIGISAAVLGAEPVPAVTERGRSAPHALGTLTPAPPGAPSAP